MTAGNRGPELTSIGGVFLGLVWLFVLLRVYVRAFISKNWAHDDSFLIISLIFFSSYCGCALVGIHYGTGRHIADLPRADIPKGLYYWWLCELFYTITTVFIRLSIAVFLLRICIQPLQRRAIYGTLGGVLVFSTFYFFLVLFQCSPVSYFWGQYEGMKGSCIDPAWVPNASIAHSAVSFTADLLLVLVPLSVISSLQMNLRTKIVVCSLLSLGILAGIATLIRIPYIKVLALTDDFLFATTDVAIWSTVEPGLGIIAAAGACLRPLFRSLLKLSSRGTAAYGTGAYGNGGAGTARGGRSTHTSNWRNSRMALGHLKHKDGSKVELTGKGLEEAVGGGKGTTTTTTTSTSRANSQMGRREGDKGITVSKTVEVSRVYEEESDGTSSGGLNTPWPQEVEVGKARDERDMV